MSSIGFRHGGSAGAQVVVDIAVDVLRDHMMNGVWHWWNCGSGLDCITLVVQLSREVARNAVHLGAPFAWDGARIALNVVVIAAGSSQG